MAYLANLTRLQANVRTEVAQMERCSAAEDHTGLRLAAKRLLEHLDADVKEVKADIEALIDGGEW